MEKKNIIVIAAVAATLALAGAAVGTVYAVTSKRSSALDNALINTTTTADPNTLTTTEDPTDPTDPNTPDEPGDPNTPDTPEEPQEPEVPSIDPGTVYDFSTIKDLLTNYEELNGSFAIIKVKVAGPALGIPGWTFFQDAEEETITSRQQINDNMSNFLGRQDQGNNNVGLNRGDIITISGTVTWGHNSKLGCDLVVIQ